MVPSYLRQREGKKEVVNPKPELAGKTLGVSLFKEWELRAAIECAGVRGGQSRSLRHSIADGVSKLEQCRISAATTYAESRFLGRAPCRRSAPRIFNIRIDAPVCGE
jgi:hypothetical protein